jgi:hypothetical protein
MVIKMSWAVLYPIGLRMLTDFDSVDPVLASAESEHKVIALGLRKTVWWYGRARGCL